MSEFSQWTALAGIAISMLTLAGTAFAYVVRLYLDRSDRHRDQFFELMKFLDNNQAPIAGKIAAVYHLRSFPKHRDFIIRFCQSAPQFVSGNATQPLLSEFEATRQYFERK